MKRPERKKHIAILSKKPLFPIEGFEEHRTVEDWVKFGYNQCKEEFDAYLPCQIELLRICEKAHMEKNLPTHIAKIIHERIWK